MRIVPMWETEDALYHYNDKERAEHHTGESVALKHVVVDKDFFISTWQLKSEEEIRGVFDTEEDAKDYLLLLHEKKYGSL